MDFDGAAARLARDQSKIRDRRNGGGVSLSEKAKRQAEFQKKQQARLRIERETKRQIEQYRRHFMHQSERSLKEKSIGPSGSALLLQPTSIHGDGDKIALPPSVLETITSSATAAAGDDVMTGDGNPWTFRIGILNPDYSFPASPLIQKLTPPKVGIDDPMEEDDDDDDDHDSDDNEHEGGVNEAYLDELSHKYVAYTHCTVVEFTQEEGQVGVPQPIAIALLDPGNRHESMQHVQISKTRTVDPAAKSMTDSADQENVDHNDIAMNQTPVPVENDSTPGHLAWGAFDIPNTQLEISMVRLPKGRACTLTPTPEAIRSNFYGLKDVKLVLEQSLIRTRATLSAGDVVSTWHRGVKFDLNVISVNPSTFHAVTCINTDIEVDFGEARVENANDNVSKPSQAGIENSTPESTGFRLGGGDALSSPTMAPGSSSKSSLVTKPLIPEPPADQKEGVCTVQIRSSGGQGKRRFAVDQARVKDLLLFAASILNCEDNNYQLVTRFPRRELKWGEGEDETLAKAGITQGQELFLVEQL